MNEREMEKKEEGKNETEERVKAGDGIQTCQFGRYKMREGKAQGGRGWENKGERQTLALEKELK